MNLSTKLNNLQLELLKLFNYDVSESQLMEIKSMLGNYFAESARAEMDKLWKQDDWSSDTTEQWVDEHLRKNSKKLLGSCSFDDFKYLCVCQ